MNWSFPSNNNGDINGISNSGVETFQGTPLKSLARETCQNSLDAAKDGCTVEIEFKPFVLETDEIPDIESLEKAFSASLDFWSLQSSKKAKDFFKNAIKVIDTGAVPFLRISDFNTTGLLGSNQEYNSPWCNLTKSSGNSDKAGTAGGSFGIGKFAPFACSDLRTVFYSTLDTDGISASQGISRITSFRRKEDNEITVGVGYYGDKNNFPVHSQLKLDPNFTRGTQTGTDIFIAGFNRYSTDWKNDIISSILDGFLYAVYSGSLIVRVDDVEVCKETLPSLIEEYKPNITENADKYYAVLSSTETIWYVENFKNFGKIRLGLIIESDMHRKVAMIRKTGMKIMDRGNISGVIPFAGVMLIEGDKINDFLRSIENPQHTKWEPERSEKRGFAREFVRDLINYIKDCLEKLKQQDSSEEIDPSVGEYLPDETECQSFADKHPKESLPDTIKAIEKSVPITKKPSPSDISQIEHDTSIDDKYGIIIDNNPASGGGHTDGKGNTGYNGHGGNQGNRTGSETEEHRKAPANIASAKVRIVCLNKSNGEYSITFVPSTSASEGYLELFLSAESGDYEAPIEKVFVIGNSSLSVESNKIKNISFKANEPVRLKVTLNYHDYCSMEVRAYGYKI